MLECLPKLWNGLVQETKYLSLISNLVLAKVKFILFCNLNSKSPLRLDSLNLSEGTRPGSSSHQQIM